MGNNAGKFYPAASEEIAKLLGLEPDKAPHVTPPSMVVPSGAETDSIDVESTEVVIEHPHGSHTATPVVVKVAFHKKLLRVGAVVLPYLAVFAVGVMVYYFYFADPSNRPQITKTDTQQEQLKEKQLAYEQLKKDQSKLYYAWVSQFFFDVSDPSKIAPDTVATNGLTNFENYLLNLNPKNYSVLQNGKSDAENVLNGTDPTTGDVLNDTQKDLVAKYFNQDDIRGRLASLKAVPNDVAPVNPPQGEVAGSSTEVRGTNNTVVTPKPAPTPVTPPSGLNDISNPYDINTSILGTLVVPTMDVNVPVVWTTNTNNFDTDLKRGVVHYPGTPYPGGLGTAYISGHSSNYAWVKADYNKVFAKIEQLPIGGTFTVTVTSNSGKKVTLHYTVQRKQKFAPNDQAQFENTAESVVALSTCWPINSTKERYVAFGKLTSVD